MATRNYNFTVVHLQSFRFPTEITPLSQRDVDEQISTLPMRALAFFWQDSGPFGIRVVNSYGVKSWGLQTTL